MNKHITELIDKYKEELFQDWNSHIEVMEDNYLQEFKQNKSLNREIFEMIVKSMKRYDTEEANELRQFYAKLLNKEWSLNYLTAAFQQFRRAVLKVILKESSLKAIVLELYEQVDEWFDPIIAHLVNDCSTNWQTAFSEQQATMKELTAPMIPVFDKVCVMPLIGSIGDDRAGMIKENLLNGISRHNCEYVLLDITGVPVVDTFVADHLTQAIHGASLLGSKCIVVGIRPEIAQTLVHLGVKLDILTFNTLHRGIEYVSAQLETKMFH